MLRRLKVISSTPLAPLMDVLWPFQHVESRLEVSLIVAVWHHLESLLQAQHFPVVLLTACLRFSWKTVSR
jgi:hypothetical protein